MTDMEVHLSKLTQAVKRACPLLESEDIAEAVWLAQFMDFVLEEPKFALPKAEQKNEPEIPKPLENPLPEQSGEPDNPESPTATDVTSKLNNTPIHAQSSKDEGTSQGGQPIRVPGVRMLQDRLLLERALRPLRRQVLSRQYFELDEAATIDASAEQNIITPVLKGKAERWLEAHIVIDCGLSMVVWRETLHELTLLFKNSGIYANVQIWYLFTDEEKAYLTASNQTEARHCNPAKLLNPRKQQLVLMCTDCASSAWFSGSVTKDFLSCWQNKMPLAMIQMLPQRLWLGTALRNSELVNFTSSTPASLNKCLVNDNSWFDEDEQLELMQLPVITIDPISLNALVKVLTGNKGQWVSGVLVDQETFPVELTKELEQLSAEQRLNNFRQQASPLARKLAEYFSCIPLVLPVMRMIQHEMLPESSATHLAEVFLGGLIKKVETKINSAEYVFHAGVIEKLQDFITGMEKHEVHLKLTNYVSSNHSKATDFCAIIRNEQASRESPCVSDDKYFADISSQITGVMQLNKAPVGKYNILELFRKDDFNFGIRVSSGTFEQPEVEQLVEMGVTAYSSRMPDLVWHTFPLIRQPEVEQLVEMGVTAYSSRMPDLVGRGQTLFNWIDRYTQGWLRSMSQTPAMALSIDVRVGMNDVGLRHLPWELLHDGTQFLCANELHLFTPLRRVSNTHREWKPEQRQLSVLFMASSPENVYPVLDFESEEAGILQATAHLPLNLQVEESGSLQGLAEHLIAKAETPDVIHISGHARVQPDGQCVFLLEDDMGMPAPTTPYELAKTFVEAGRYPRILFLSGGGTAESDLQHNILSFSEQMVQAGVPVVLGWAARVGDVAASQAAASLYEKLANGDGVTEAVAYARQQLWAARSPYWHLLRVYTDSSVLHPLVGKGRLRRHPKEFRDIGKSIEFETVRNSV